MNRSTKYILFFLFISILGYSQEVDKRYITEPNPERFFPELNDINKVKYVKTTHYLSDKKGKFLRPTGTTPSFFVNEFPYRYIYTLNPYNTQDTLSKFVYKYYKSEGTLEYVEMHNYSSNKSTYLYYDKDETIKKKEFFWNNELVSTTNWIYNKRRDFKQLIRVSIISQDIQKREYRSFYHYLYNNDNQLIEKITITNDEITEIRKWEYIGGIAYEIGRVEKCLNYTPLEYFNEEYKYTYDKHKNWIKKIGIGSEANTTTEREIIYK